MPSNSSDPAAVRDLVAGGESQTLEFKSSPPDTSVLLRNVVGFANSQGGTLIIGVDDGGRVVGVANPSNVKDRIDRIIRSHIPDLHVLSTIGVADDKAVIILTIPPGTRTPYVGPDGAIVVRAGVTTRLVTREELSHLLIDRVGSVESMHEQLERVVNLIVQLNEQVVAAERWPNKIRDMTIAGIIGAVLGYGLSLLSRLIGQ